LIFEIDLALLMIRKQTQELLRQSFNTHQLLIRYLMLVC